MSNSLSDALPWPKANRQEQTRTSETTRGGSSPTPWVVVAQNLNPGEAVVIKARLESEEIPALIQQEAVGSVLGLTVGPLGVAKISVPEPLAERALDLLAITFDDEEDSWDDEGDDLEEDEVSG